jgi:hypothetical protein
MCLCRVQEVRAHTATDVPVLLVGNKADLAESVPGQRAVAQVPHPRPPPSCLLIAAAMVMKRSYRIYLSLYSLVGCRIWPLFCPQADAEAFARAHELAFIETSARTGFGVAEAFELIAGGYSRRGLAARDWEEGVRCLHAAPSFHHLAPSPCYLLPPAAAAAMWTLDEERRALDAEEAVTVRGVGKERAPLAPFSYCWLRALCPPPPTHTHTHHRLSPAGEHASCHWRCFLQLRSSSRGRPGSSDGPWQEGARPTEGGQRRLLRMLGCLRPPHLWLLLRVRGWRRRCRAAH